MTQYTKVAQLKTVAALRNRLAELGIDLPVDDDILTEEEESPLAEPTMIGKFQVGNRWCIHPMEGWDANADGSASELTMRRWKRFGESGAKLIWGGEASAVQHDGKANPNQLLATARNESSLAELRSVLVKSHEARFGRVDDLLIGLQLTHSGRFCRPNSKRLEPRIAYHHPLLDRKFGIDPSDETVVWTDDDLERLIDAYVAAAHVATNAGFRFVDVKACHGYLLHEFLSARSRPGRFGGDFQGRTLLIRTIIERLRAAIPELMVLVRLSLFDLLPYESGGGVGQPMDHPLPYKFGFGIDAQDPHSYDLTEPLRLIELLRDLDVAAINLSCGSAYYNPHILRPAIFPPSDGYQPPEDPLVGVARQIVAARECKAAFPELPMVGTGYSYLQDYLPHVAQAVVREGWIDMVGLGRMVLSYPELPANTLKNGTMNRKLVCRTFSDCTTAPRNGIISGCFPLDQFYKDRPEALALRDAKKRS